MRRFAILLAAALVIGGDGVCSTAPQAPVSIRHVCTINGCPGHCAKGKWLCNGKCIANNRACRLVP